MAEGLLRYLRGDRFEAYSAGTEATHIRQWAYDCLSPDPARRRALTTGRIAIDRILGAEQFAGLLSESNEVLSGTGRMRTAARRTPRDIAIAALLLLLDD